VDPDTVAEPVRRGPWPVNVMAGPGIPAVTGLEAVGGRRVSEGTALARTAYGVMRRAAAELLDSGTCVALEGAVDFGTVNGAGTAARTRR
jgi:2-methylisocitrate lyase-like PEP mutase family enzyme